jgi:hypothetical protein
MQEARTKYARLPPPQPAAAAPAPAKTNRALEAQRRKQLRAHYAARYRVR